MWSTKVLGFVLVLTACGGEGFSGGEGSPIELPTSAAGGFPEVSAGGATAAGGESPRGDSGGAAPISSGGATFVASGGAPPEPGSLTEDGMTIGVHGERLWCGTLLDAPFDGIPQICRCFPEGEQGEWCDEGVRAEGWCKLGKCADRRCCIQYADRCECRDPLAFTGAACPAIVDGGARVPSCP